MYLSPHTYTHTHTGDYSDEEGSSDEEERSPRDQLLCNSSGFKDFRVKSMKAAHIGRKEIELALQGGE